MEKLADRNLLSGVCLLLSFLIMLAGAMLFITRPDSSRQPLPNIRITFERGLIMSAVVLSIIGFFLLKELIQGTQGTAWIVIGSSLYLLGGLLILVAELAGLSGGERAYSLVVGYVVLAFLGQAAVGVSIVQSDTLPDFVGWAAIAWNLFWLILLPIISPSDMYFPVLHHVMPMLIGISLLIR